MKKISFNSPLILTFTLLSFISLILGIITGNFTTSLFFTTSNASLFNPLKWITMVTYIFGHANFSHWFGNFLLILIIGPSLEEKYGSSRLFILILITAFATRLINNIFFSTGLLGASGIVFMMILLSSFTNFKDGTIPLTFILVAVMYLGQELINCFEADNISQFAHIFGGIIGSIFGFGLNRKM